MPRPRKPRLIPSIVLYNEELIRTLSKEMHTILASATEPIGRQLRELARDVARVQRRIVTMPAGGPGPATAPRSNDPLGALTEREREIASELMSGARNPDIAKRYKLSVRTVETHRAHILKKLNVNSLAQLILYASERGVLPRRPVAVGAPTGPRRRARR
jgi:DNA-binding NarL/FixJ family response regulator